MLALAKSDIGKIRESNEDSYVCVPPLFVVADGMGGHVAGEIASQLAADTVRKHFAELDEPANPEAVLGKAIEQANSLIYRMARFKTEYAGMGTTLTAAYLDGRRLYWGHVGDSRLYLLRDSRMTQITEDHSLVGELVRSGTISPEDALVHPHRNILTRAVGTGENIVVDTGALEVENGDALLLCTDGLTNMLRDETIFDVLSACPADAAVLDKLIEQANMAGGLDNITAVLVRCGVC